MDFTSDNICGVSEEILAALSLANQAETAAPYGADAMSMSLNDQFSTVFGKPCVVFPVVTGTAANALALGALVQPWQAILTHEKAHVETMECGAPEFMTGGAKLIGVPGDQDKVTVEALEQAVQNSGQGCLHRSQVAAISLTQTTDAGTVYTSDEIKAITAFAKTKGLKVHMDGARFANAVASLGCHPADLIEGVDVLSFGATKNGSMNAEAIVFFNTGLAETFAFQAKRAGHIVSKARYLSAQLQAYLADDLWLRNARNANATAAYLARSLEAVHGVEIPYTVQSNLVFADVDASLANALGLAGVGCYTEYSPKPGKRRIRLACGFSTRREAVDQLLSVLNAAGSEKVAA